MSVAPLSEPLGGVAASLHGAGAAAAYWHPVIDSAALRDKPQAVQLMDHAVVLWRDAQGQAHAWADRCPHRGARLSLGRVCDGQLECAYHGWRFAETGRCVHVPALPEFVPPAGHSAQVFAAQEAYGLVWVRLVDGAHSLPLFSAESDAGLRKVNCGPYDVATSAPRIVENFLDMAHFSFVHAGWLGERGRSAVADYTVQATATGLLATNCWAWQPQSHVHATQGAMVEYRYEVTAPYAAVLTKVPQPDTTATAAWRESIALFICPLTAQTSRVWFRLAVADFDSPDIALQAFQHTIFTQDQPVLESQSPSCLPLDPRAEAHTAADKASAAYRRFLQGAAISFGTC